MTFESEGLPIVAIYIWLPPASYVVFLTTLDGFRIEFLQNMDIVIFGHFIVIAFI